MNIIVFGAAGEVGRRVVNEALSRGHMVSVVVRRQSQRGLFPSTVAVHVTNIGENTNFAALMAGQDLVISALRPPQGQEESLVQLTDYVLSAAERYGVRSIVVGGAASLRLPGKTATVLTEPGFLPASVVPIAQACQAQYDLILTNRKADWSYIAPPAILEAGVRTGSYRQGTDELVVDASGQSRISIEDFAVALMDEADVPQHRHRRFTAAY